MTHAKKDPAGTGEISAKSQGNSTVNGKVIPFGTKTGERGEQREKGVRGENKEDLTRRLQKNYIQTDLFPDGYAGTTGKPSGNAG
jgi:hypothetical protein